MASRELCGQGALQSQSIVLLFLAATDYNTPHTKFCCHSFTEKKISAKVKADIKAIALRHVAVSIGGRNRGVASKARLGRLFKGRGRGKPEQDSYKMHGEEDHPRERGGAYQERKGRERKPTQREKHPTAWKSKQGGCKKEHSFEKRELYDKEKK